MVLPCLSTVSMFVLQSAHLFPCRHVCSSVHICYHVGMVVSHCYDCSYVGMFIPQFTWLFLIWHVFFSFSIFLLPWWHGCSSISMIVLMLQCFFLHQHVFLWSECNQKSFYLITNYVIFVNILVCRQFCFSGNSFGDLLAIVQACPMTIPRPLQSGQVEF